MARVKRALGSWLVIFTMLFLVCGYWVSTVWPPVGHWYELRSLRIDDAKVGQPITMHVDRTIHEPFYGTFAVVVRKQKPDGWMVVCNGTGGGDYRSDAVLPVPLTLDWWSNRACPTIDEPGDYAVTTTIAMVSPIGLRRIVKHDSNIFRVTE